MRILVLTLLLVFSGLPAQAKNFDHSGFSSLPVLDGGRIKPMDSFARKYLKLWSGRDVLEGKHASEWLAMILFDPQSASGEKLFYLRNNQVKAQLGLAERDEDYFSLQELLPGIDATKNQLAALINQGDAELTADQRIFLNIHENVAGFSNLMRSFSMFLPLDIVVPEKYQSQLEQPWNSYLRLARLENKLLEDLQGVIRNKGEDLEKYSDEEKQIALLSFQLQNLRLSGETSQLFKVIPAKEEWLSPWEFIVNEKDLPDSRLYLMLWQEAAMAYREAGNKDWHLAIAKIKDHIDEKSLYTPYAFTLEQIYNAVNPYFWARLLYVIGILCLTGAFIWQKGNLSALAMLLATLGAFIHASAIISRILILDRPPVGTLYESVLFVSLVCVLIGLVLCARKPNNFVFLSAVVAAVTLLLIAPVIAPDGENLEVLVAVLNTNFWLATHVIVITAGYGACLLSACMAHLYLFLRINNDKKDEGILKLYNATYRISILALLLTAVGTVLGGIWADQSWGRFWGWDPKENGALLIVLWLIWLQHGRISGNLKDVPFMAGMAYLNVIVAVAWFGVNLLGVGLHSYGFTSGLAYGLMIFCTFETALIAFLWILTRLRNKGGVGVT